MLKKFKDFDVTQEAFVPKSLGDRHDKRMIQFNKSIADIKEKTDELIKAHEYIEQAKETLRNYYDNLKKLDSDSLVKQIENLKTCIHFTKSLKINDFGFVELFQKYLDRATELVSQREYSFDIDSKHLDLLIDLELENGRLHIACLQNEKNRDEKNHGQLLVNLTPEGDSFIKGYYGQWAHSGNKTVFWFKCSPTHFGEIYELFALDKRFKITRKGKTDHYVIENFD